VSCHERVVSQRVARHQPLRFGLLTGGQCGAVGVLGLFEGALGDEGFRKLGGVPVQGLARIGQAMVGRFETGAGRRGLLFGVSRVESGQHAAAVHRIAQPRRALDYLAGDAKGHGIGVARRGFNGIRHRSAVVRPGVGMDGQGHHRGGSRIVGRLAMATGEGRGRQQR
jgi:hypothetical protein